jgi:hypothetical protein
LVTRTLTFCGIERFRAAAMPAAFFICCARHKQGNLRIVRTVV